MYCTNCGRKLPEDGSPCVCQQQDAAQARYGQNTEAGETQVLQPGQYEPYANNTYTQPAQPQTYDQQQYGQTAQPYDQQQYGQTAQPYDQQQYGQTAQPYDQQQYGQTAQPYGNQTYQYAQPPVQYPVQQPVFSVLKQFFSSTAFLVTTILFSASLLFTLISNFVPSNPMVDFLNQYMRMMPSEVTSQMPTDQLYGMFTVRSGPNIMGIFTTLIFAGIPAAAFWITWASAKSAAAPSVKTTGLTILKVFSIISVVAWILGAVLIVIVAIVAIAAISNASGYASGYYDNTISIVIGALIGSFGALLGYAVFQLIYQLKVIKMLGKTTVSLQTGAVPVKASMYVAVLNFIGAVLMLFGLFGNMAMGSWMQVLTGLCNLALAVMYGILVLQFNKQLRSAGMIS